jgi:hypothetical protein
MKAFLVAYNSRELHKKLEMKIENCQRMPKMACNPNLDA